MEKVSEGPERPAGSGPGKLLLSAVHGYPGPRRLCPSPGAQLRPARPFRPAPRVLGSGEAGQRPPRATGPGAERRWGRRGLGVGWGRGGGHCAGRRPLGLLPGGRGRSSTPSPPGWRGKGSAGSGQLCAFLLLPCLAPSPPPTILPTISGEAGLIFSGRPFLSLHLGGRGPADTSALPPSSGNSPERVGSRLSSFPLEGRFNPQNSFLGVGRFAPPPWERVLLYSRFGGGSRSASLHFGG